MRFPKTSAALAVWSASWVGKAGLDVASVFGSGVIAVDADEATGVSLVFMSVDVLALDAWGCGGRLGPIGVSPSTAAAPLKTSTCLASRSNGVLV